jgi:hypothetical protein
MVRLIQIDSDGIDDGHGIANWLSTQKKLVFKIWLENEQLLERLLCLSDKWQSRIFNKIWTFLNMEVVKTKRLLNQDSVVVCENLVYVCLKLRHCTIDL